MEDAHRFWSLLRQVDLAFDVLPFVDTTGTDTTSVLFCLDMYTWDEAKFTAFFVDLVRHLPKLIVLSIVLPVVPASHCIAATAVLESKFHSFRPCFCVQITDSLESSNPSSFPWIHYQACLWPVRVTSADFLIKIFFSLLLSKRVLWGVIRVGFRSICGFCANILFLYF